MAAVLRAGVSGMAVGKVDAGAKVFQCKPNSRRKSTGFI
jgi:hypothetical protein